MKSYNHLWPRIITFENLYQAFRRARLGKRARPDVAEFEYDLEANLLALENELAGRTYQPGGYKNFVVHEPVRRKISAAPFRDRVVHHALCRVVEPLFDRAFIEESYACRLGKGTHRAIDRCHEHTRRYRYVLKADISNFFPSIDHEVLYGLFKKRIRCRDTLALMRAILDSGEHVLTGCKRKMNTVCPRDRGSQNARSSRGVVEQQPEESAHVEPEQQRADEPQQQYRFALFPVVFPGVNAAALRRRR